MEGSLSFSISPSRSSLPNGFPPSLRVCTSVPGSLRRRPMRIKSTASFRKTLSSDWDLSNSSGPWMPRLEHLDATNMLLRQRIVFLGSQVGALFLIITGSSLFVHEFLAEGFCWYVAFLLYMSIFEYAAGIYYSPKCSCFISRVIVGVPQWVYAVSLSLAKVDTVTADFIISQLLFLDAEDQKKDIKLFINSPGGSVTAGMGIYDAMKLCKADVSTACLGLAASMGAFLLAAGTKGKRFCMPNSRVMIHQPLGTAGGKATEMGLQIREMAYHKVKMNKIFSRITGKPEKQIEIDTDRDYFMNPWEAKEYGLIDAVIDDGKPVLVAPVADVIPPPKTRVWDMWNVEGSRKAKKNLPMEQKILQNGFGGGGQVGDGDKGSEQEKESATPV